MKMAQVVAHSPALFPEKFVQACRGGLVGKRWVGTWDDEKRPTAKTSQQHMLGTLKGKFILELSSFRGTMC